MILLDVTTYLLYLHVIFRISKNYEHQQQPFLACDELINLPGRKTGENNKERGQSQVSRCCNHKNATPPHTKTLKNTLRLGRTGHEIIKDTRHTLG